MAEPAYPTLFSPLRLGPVELRNRIVLSAMTTGFGFEEGAPTPDLLAYFAARSGGVGMAVVAFGAVTPEGRVEQQIPWMWREDAASVLAPLASAIAAAGAVPCLQLGHGGRQVSPVVIGRAPVAPSAIAPSVHVATAPETLGITEVHRIVAAFGSAAKAAAGAGFRAVEIHGAHGYLIQQFLSPQSNRRSDEYGRDRALFGVRVIEAVAAAAPDIAVTVRINGDDLTSDGMTPEIAADVAARFVAAGADALTVSAGVYGSVPYTIPLLDDAEGIFLDAAAVVRGAVDVPVVGVGRITDPATAERAIATGRCDAVAVGRALLADPDWVEKARTGATADIRPCIATVQGCAGMLQHGDPVSCTVNPEVGRESRRVPTPTRRLRVAVVGAGPGGMEAALCASRLGHEVRLIERSDAIGGSLRLAAATPPLAHLDRLVSWYERETDRAGFEVQTGEEASVASLTSQGWAEVVIAATGAVSALPVVDGFDRLPAWSLEGLLTGKPSSLGTSDVPHAPIIVGAGQRGLALALWCAAGGAVPTLVAASRLGADTSGLARRAYLARLTAAGVRIVTGTLHSVSAQGALVVTAAGTETVPGDGVVLADPVRPHTMGGAGSSGLPVVTIGDARQPRGIGPAIAEGRDVAERLHELVG